ncbi:hypothetical protein P7C70_g1273, partial [Phenoliferia sp. Uapishka_3]
MPLPRRGPASFPPRCPSPYPYPVFSLHSPPALEVCPSQASDVSFRSTATERSLAVQADDERAGMEASGEEICGESEESTDAETPSEDGENPFDGASRRQKVGAAWLALKERKVHLFSTKTSSLGGLELEDRQLAALLHWTSSCEGNRPPVSRLTTKDESGNEEGTSEGSSDELNRLLGDEAVRARNPNRAKAPSSNVDFASGPPDDTTQESELPFLSRYLLAVAHSFEAVTPSTEEQTGALSLYTAVEETAAISREVLVIFHHALPYVYFGVLGILAARWLYSTQIVE